MTRPALNVPRTAVVIIVHGRHRHLQRQLLSLDGLVTADSILHVVVAMADSDVAQLVARAADGPVDVAHRVVVELPVGEDAELPLAAARNVGASAGLEWGADLLVFLDVDCLAHPDLITDYRAATHGGRASTASRDPEPTHNPDAGRASAASRDPVDLTGPILWCGQVSYLPPLPAGVADYPLIDLDSWSAPHSARPVLPPGAIQLTRDVRLFWSLNFAVTARDWHASGGFHPGYRGYGGEDTDFARGVAARGGGLGWIGGAAAFHQHHPTSSPPWQHLAAIVRNAHVFRDRWGTFPMEGWLEAFAAAGAIDYRPDDGILELTADPPPPHD
ncbi:glycosyltransferase family 2 protein [Nakamurella sp. A5-74]|uniref:Glycosyltransferase family 2 protein n=1 Tax=Nakamurella sp. A5-74 TaxID=3158264 RepID=A0AAU8DNM5_9ACTN